MRNRDKLLTKEPNPHLRKKLDPSAEATLYSPRFQGAKAQLRLARTRAQRENLRFFNILIAPQRFEGGMGVQRDVGGLRKAPLILLGPAQSAACWNQYKGSIEVHRNLNSRLTAPLRFLLMGASRMGYVGLPPKPAWGHCPQTPSSLRGGFKLLGQLSHLFAYKNSRTFPCGRA